MPANDIQFESQTKAKLNNSKPNRPSTKWLKKAWICIWKNIPSKPKWYRKSPFSCPCPSCRPEPPKMPSSEKAPLKAALLPGKLADCQSRDPKNRKSISSRAIPPVAQPNKAAIAAFQAIFPLRGKILNTERSRLDKIIEFEELKNLIVALGTGVGDTFDVKNSAITALSYE